MANPNLHFYERQSLDGIKVRSWSLWEQKDVKKGKSSRTSSTRTNTSVSSSSTASLIRAKSVVTCLPLSENHLLNKLWAFTSSSCDWENLHQVQLHLGLTHVLDCSTNLLIALVDSAHNWYNSSWPNLPESKSLQILYNAIQRLHKARAMVRLSDSERYFNLSSKLLKC